MPEQHAVAVTYQDTQYNVAVKTDGAGDHLLVFIHGLGCTKESFDGAFANKQLLGAYALCSFDMLGFGDSDKPDDFSYDMQAQADITKQIIGYLKPKRVSIVGHSMGGAVGLLLARDLLKSGSTSLEQFVSVEGNLVGLCCGMVSRGIARQKKDEFADHGLQTLKNDLSNSSRADLNTWAEWIKQSTPTAMLQSARSLFRWSNNGELLNIFNELPNAIYIYGSEEPKDYLKDLLAPRQMHYIRLNHFMMIQNPKRFFDELANLLSA